jgi:hypothetical protein
MAFMEVKAAAEEGGGFWVDAVVSKVEELEVQVGLAAVAVGLADLDQP